MNRVLRTTFIVFGVVAASVTGGYFLLDTLTGDTVSGKHGELPDIAYRAGAIRLGIAIAPNPPTVGDNRLTLRLQTRDGDPLQDASIRAFGEMPAHGSMAPMRAGADMRELDAGVYRGNLKLGMRGEWPLKLQIEAPGTEPLEMQFGMATGRRGLEPLSGVSALANATDGAGSDSGQPVTPDEEGFHRSGRYRIRVTPLDPPLAPGDNRLRVTLRDADGNPVTGAQLRIVAQRLDDDGEPQARGDTMRLNASETPGVYTGRLPISAAGEHVLAIDADSEEHGHADWVMRFVTGESRLRVTSRTARDVAYYTCSMHPSVRKAEPGECPICGMSLTAVTTEAQQSGTIAISEAQRQRIGVTTAQALRRPMTRVIRAPGRVAIDERRVRSVSLKFDGYVETLDADFEGKPVARGDRLLTAYSPELLSAQQEYLATRARLSRRGEGDSLLQAARQRLRLWDIDGAQIRALERRGTPFEALPITAPANGIVINKRINAGSAFSAGETLLEIADLSAVTIDAEVYEEDLPWVSVGMSAEIRFPQGGGEPLTATVDYVYPRLVDATRTARIRLVLDNPEGRLKPAMYARVDLQADLGERLAVPVEAVIVSGEQRVVFKELDDGRLQPVRVRTGARADGWIAIREGLAAGDTVVTSGNFLLASEARLKMGDSAW